MDATAAETEDRSWVYGLHHNNNITLLEAALFTKFKTTMSRKKNNLNF